MKIQDTQPIKPLCLRIKNAKSEIFASISNIAQKHTIPYSILDLIVSDALYQIQTGANREIEQAQTTYNRQLAEIQKSQNKEDDNGSNNEIDRS